MPPNDGFDYNEWSREELAGFNKALDEGEAFRRARVSSEFIVLPQGKKGKRE